MTGVEGQTTGERRYGRMVGLLVMAAAVLYLLGIIGSHLLTLDVVETCLQHRSNGYLTSDSDALEVSRSFVPLGLQCEYSDGEVKQLALTWVNWVSLGLLFTAAVVSVSGWHQRKNA